MTPTQVDLLLASGSDNAAKTALAEKVGRFLPAMNKAQNAQVERMITQVVSVLAKDRLPTIRAVLAEQIKSLEHVPSEIIQDLARDVEAAVAAPVLRFSPLLTDRDLVNIVSAGISSEALVAVSQRQDLAWTLHHGAPGFRCPDVYRAMSEVHPSFRQTLTRDRIDHRPGFGQMLSDLAVCRSACLDYAITHPFIAVHRKGSPVISISCRITANLRTTLIRLLTAS